MDVDLSDIQTVVLTPVQPAIVFAAVVGLVGGAFIALVQFGLDYRQNKQWLNKKKMIGFTFFCLVLFAATSVGLAASQLSMNPTIPLREVNNSTLSTMVTMCPAICLSNWQIGRGRTLFSKPVSAERGEDD